MATQVTNYQCPACTGPLKFGAVSGKLQCEYCGGSFAVEEIEALYADDQAAAQEAFSDRGEWDGSAMHTDWEEGMRAYSCPSCGAELLCEETTAATSCPYCGNPSIVPGQFAGQLKPEHIIPFRLTQTDAEKKLREFYRGKVFLPKEFKTENHIREIRGIYVPFWLFDGKVDADMLYRATRVHTHRRGDEEITVTDHFMVRRAGQFAFEKVPVDASSKMPDEYMDAIEPFDYRDLSEFSTAYLPGFLADRYDVDVEHSSSRADERCRNSAKAALRETVIGYHSCIPIRENIGLQRGKVSYAMLPVYILHTKWRDKEYLFSINGQTGKVAGTLPVHWGKFFGLLAAIALPLMAVMTAIVL